MLASPAGLLIFLGLLVFWCSLVYITESIGHAMPTACSAACAGKCRPRTARAAARGLIAACAVRRDAARQLLVPAAPRLRAVGAAAALAVAAAVLAHRPRRLRRRLGARRCVPRLACRALAPPPACSATRVAAPQRRSSRPRLAAGAGRLSGHRRGPRPSPPATSLPLPVAGPAVPAGAGYTRLRAVAQGLLAACEVQRAAARQPVVPAALRTRAVGAAAARAVAAAVIAHRPRRPRRRLGTRGCALVPPPTFYAVCAAALQRRSSRPRLDAGAGRVTGLLPWLATLAARRFVVAGRSPSPPPLASLPGYRQLPAATADGRLPPLSCRRPPPARRSSRASALSPARRMSARPPPPAPPPVFGRRVCCAARVPRRIERDLDAAVAGRLAPSASLHIELPRPSWFHSPFGRVASSVRLFT